MTGHFYLTRIMPIGLFMALTLFFGNVVYLYLSVSFIQMLKVCWTPARPRMRLTPRNSGKDGPAAARSLHIGSGDYQWSKWGHVLRTLKDSHRIVHVDGQQSWTVRAGSLVLCKA